MVLPDTSTEFGARVARRLATEDVIWLTTVNPNGGPVSIPIWFFWDGDNVLMYSQPNKPKLRNVARNPKVELHFNSDQYGNDVIRIAGSAWIDDGAPPASDIAEMMTKYARGLESINTTPEGFAGEYSVALRVRPTKINGY